MAFYIHLLAYVLGKIMFFLINIITYDDYLWFIFPMIGWGLGLGIHGLTTLSIGKFGANWEEKKIREYMEKEDR